MPDEKQPPVESHVLARIHDLLVAHLLRKMSHQEQTDFIRKIIDQSQLKATFVITGIKDVKEAKEIKAAS